MEEIQVSPKGIKKHLRSYNIYTSISEYVWNALEADAHRIEINFQDNGIGSINEIHVIDDGYGIDRNNLDHTFKAVLYSRKSEAPAFATRRNRKHGRGRLTFFTFAEKAQWKTVFKKDSTHWTYNIFVNAETIDKFETDKEIKVDATTGTAVSFFNIIKTIDPLSLQNALRHHIARDVCWFMALRSQSAAEIYINNKPLAWQELISDSAEFSVTCPTSGKKFSAIYIRWKESLHAEFSRYYFMSDDGEEKYSHTTLLNKKGDGFFHSVYIKSDFFDDFDPSSIVDGEIQLEIFGDKNKANTFKNLISQINEFLLVKRRPFLRETSGLLVEEYEKSGVFPEIDTRNIWEKQRISILKESIRGLYEAQPRIFSDLNMDQKKTFVRLMDLIVDAGEADRLFPILEQIVELDSDERERLKKLLDRSSLSAVIKTLEMVQNRYKVVSDLKNLVFNEDLDALEIPHIQGVFENHYWLIGEKYNLVTAAEPDFIEALRRYRKIIYDKHEKSDISHRAKNREMDLFMVRQDVRGTISNIVVELKRPGLPLGKDEYDQIYEYQDLISKVDDFNSTNTYWEFYLIGSKLSTDGFIKNQFKNSQNHGEQNLAYKVDNFKIYVKTWSDVVADFEIRHDFVTRKLELVREKLSAGPAASADDLLQRAKDVAANTEEDALT